MRITTFIYLFCSFQDDGKPEDWQRRRHGNIPGLLMTSMDGAMVLLGKEIFLVFKHGKIANAVVAFLASFYLLDLDYPTCWLTSPYYGDLAIHLAYYGCH